MLIIHVDMDAFYASVEVRDNPALAGKPLMIGALPTERGVVATCSYEARKYGIHSAMNIKEAYRLCPNGIYMHGNFDKYRAVSAELHKIWNDYASASEYIALDEAYLDVTETAVDVEKAREFAREIKRRVLEEQRLTCSVGLAYSKTAAKTASEEKKPNGYYEILTPEAFTALLAERNVKALYTVGAKTAEKLSQLGIFKIDDRKVIPYRPEDAKSISREMTFQEDVADYEFLKHALLLLSISVERLARRVGLHGKGVVLKLTYANMKSITRSKILPEADHAITIYREAVRLLDHVQHDPVRLVGVGIYNLTGEEYEQLVLEGFEPEQAGNPENELETLYKTIEYMRKKKR